MNAGTAVMRRSSTREYRVSMKRFVTPSLVVILCSWTTAHAQDVRPFGLIDSRSVDAAVAESARSNLDGSLEENATNPAGQDATPPSPPAHTGLSALAHETWNDVKAFPQRQS